MIKGIELNVGVYKPIFVMLNEVKHLNSRL